MRIRWGRVAIAYLLLALLGAGLSVWIHGAHPFGHPSPWFVLAGIDKHLVSAAAGLAFGIGVVAMTRLTVVRWSWARQFHAQLRPVAAGMTTPTILLVAAVSSLGEELVFRSLLTPLLGVWLQGLLFGALHQIPGRSRWIWMGWAATVGIAIGALYAASGSLAGPLVAHALINAMNLAYLRDHRPAEAVSG